MSAIMCEDFQHNVSEYLLRHQSILDLLSKTLETTGRVNRAITKSVTSCGCLKIHADKEPIPENANLEDFKHLFSSHLEGQLCEHCRDVILKEMGKNLFYITALCHTLGISLQEVLEKENDKVTTLGRFNMT